MTETIDRAYQSTRLTPAEERALECQRQDCDSPVDATEPCERCEERFCCAHLYEGLCAGCLAVDEAADALLARQVAA